MYPERLKQLRMEYKCTQNDLAVLLGCTQADYSHFENGRRKLSVDNLIKIADYYCCSTDYILELTDQKRRV